MLSTRTATLFATAATTFALAGCEIPKRDQQYDLGLHSKHLSQLKAGIWIDPEGCDHWLIDDGIEGYMTARRAPDGKPVCSGAPGGPGVAIGPYKSGGEIPDAS